MKVAIRLYKWLLLSIILQVIAYLFINNIYLGNRDNILDKMKVIQVASIENQDINFTIPSNASQIETSYDNSYVSYILDGKLQIVDTSSKKAVKVIENSFVSSDKKASKDAASGNISCYKWVPDKNTVMYALSASGNSPGRVQLFTYDADTGNEHIGVNIADSSLQKGSEAEDIIISPLTMVTYLKVKTGNSQSKLYRIDIMDQISPPFAINSGNTIKIGHYTENLVFQEDNNKLAVKTGLSSTLKHISFNNKIALLDIAGIKTTGKDIIYAGELNGENKVTKILYGSIDTPVDKWTSLSLKKPLAAENITINNDGVIYNIAKDEKAVYNISDDSKTSFAGNFMEFRNGFIVALDNNILKIKALKK